MESNSYDPRFDPWCSQHDVGTFLEAVGVHRCPVGGDDCREGWI